MDKTKALKKIRNLAEEMQKTGDAESAVTGHVLNFVALFLALGHIDLLLEFLGNMGALVKRTEGKKDASGSLIMPVASDIIVPN